jgi:hypothetical protein
MSAKDTAIGTAKRIVAEIVGDGELAEEGSRQSNGTRPLSAPDTGRDDLALLGRAGSPDGSLSVASPLTDEERFTSLLGPAALKIWSDLPRDAQERLFAAAVDDGIIANSLAVFLHDRHPKTAHPPKPTRIA